MPDVLVGLAAGPVALPAFLSGPAAFPAQMAALRHGRGLSLRRLAGLANVSHDALGAWERGARLPRLPELEAALTALGVVPAERCRLIALLPVPRALRHFRHPEAAPDGWGREAGLRPGAGDLLRAMRGRGGLTQAEAAKAVGVSQGRLAEWERSGDWPDAGRLRALCAALGALPEECAALTAGVGLDAAADGPEGMDPAAWEAHIHRAWQGPDPLRDLRLVTLEVRLWPLAARDERARPWLMAAYACHARSLSDDGRLAQALPRAARALDLARAGYGGGGQWAWAAIVTGRALRGGAGPPAEDGEAAARRRGRRAARFLKTWEGAVRRPENRAWVWSDMAYALGQSGEAEAAVSLSRRACRMALESEDPYESPNRWSDLAHLLAGLGRFGAALEALDGARPLAALAEDTAASQLMLEAECLLGLGRRAEAQDRAAEALEQCVRPGLAPLRPRAEALARRF